MEDVPSPTVLTPFFLQFRLTPADDEWTHNGSIQDLHKILQIPMNCRCTQPSIFLRYSENFRRLLSVSCDVFVVYMGYFESIEWPILVQQLLAHLWSAV